MRVAACCSSNPRRTQGVGFSNPRRTQGVLQCVLQCVYHPVTHIAPHTAPHTATHAALNTATFAAIAVFAVQCVAVYDAVAGCTEEWCRVLQCSALKVISRLCVADVAFVC